MYMLGITDKDINSMLQKYSKAEFLVHPNLAVIPSTLYHVSKGDINRDCKILSTEGMMKEASTSKNDQFLIATEVGILPRMREENPSKEFIPVKKDAICKYMKKITVEKVYNSLLNDVHEVKVPKNIAKKALIPIERMLAIS